MKETVAQKLKNALFAKADGKVEKEIDMLNVVVLRRISFFCAVLETAAVIFMALGLSETDNVRISIISTAFAAVLCYAMNITLRIMNKKNYYNHIVIVTICNSFSMLFIAWSMFVSGRKYIAGYQIIVFYAVVIALICFTVMLPRISVSIILASFIGFYVFMYTVDKAVGVQAFNYFAFMLICCGASIEKYSVTVAKVEGKIEAEELNDTFLRIMRHDTLSRVKNRTALMEDLPQFFDKKIIVLIFDLDKFKFINDNYGHLAGDRVIQEYAKIFCEVFDEESVYRYGGDEFVVVRRATTEEEFNSEIADMRVAADNLDVEGIKEKTDYSYGFSFGIVQNGNEFEELLVKADDMLYEQKRKKHSVQGH